MWQAGDDGPAVGPQVIFGFDSNGFCTMSTGAGLEDLGLRPGELVGRNLLELYRNAPDARDSVLRALAGERFSTESEFDGRRLWVYYEPTLDAEGNVTGVVGVATDVTEQRRIEAEARDARARASLLADLSAVLTQTVPDLPELLRVAVRSATEAVAHLGGIWLRTHEPDRLELAALWSVREDDLAAIAQLAAENVGGTPAFEVTSSDDLTASQLFDLVTEDLAGVPGADLLRGGLDEFGVRWVLRVPLRARGLLLGVMDLGRRPSLGGFDANDTSLVCDIAERCALALDNAVLLADQRDAREELMKFQALADASDDFIVIADDEGHLTYVNPALYDAGVQIESGEVWTVVTAHAGEPAATRMREALERVGRWSGDVAATFVGRELVVHAELFRLSHPETGQSLGTAGIAQDVTEVRATEAALRSANADLKRFKALVEASPDFIAIAGLDGKVQYVNPQGRAMIGMDPDVDVATTVIADYLTPEGLETSMNVEQPAVIANGHWEGESTLRSLDGPPIPVAIASFLMRDMETGEPFALATVQRDITERLQAEAALRDLADQREALLTRLVDAQDAERARIAADVHDDPVQALAVVDLRLGSLVRRLREHAPELLDIVEPLRVSVTDATARLRALLFDLEPPDLQHGLTAALHRAADEIFSGSDTEWSIAADREPDVPDSTRAVAYRIVKEALTNAQKHARADHVRVTVDDEAGGLSVSVEDDGTGLGPGPVESLPGHRGLLSMQDRATVAGGRCSIENRREGGTVVKLWLPGCPLGVGRALQGPG